MQIQSQEHKALSERKVWSVKANPPRQTILQRHSEGGDFLPSPSFYLPIRSLLTLPTDHRLQVLLLMPSETLGDNWTTSKSLERMSNLKKSKGFFSDTNDHIRH